MEQKHIKVRLLILWAHQTGQGPFATLPNEMLHLIFRFQGQPQWLPNSFSGPAGSFSLSSDKTTIKVTGMNFVSACTNKLREKGEACTWSYHIKSQQSYINVGVCVRPITKGGSCLGRGWPPSNHPTEEWGFYGLPKYGMKTHAGKALPYVAEFQGFKAGDIIKVELSKQGELRYFLNEEDLGLAFEGVNERVYGAMSFGYQQQEVTFLG